MSESDQTGNPEDRDPTETDTGRARRALAAVHLAADGAERTGCGRPGLGRRPPIPRANPIGSPVGGDGPARPRVGVVAADPTEPGPGEPGPTEPDPAEPDPTDPDRRSPSDPYAYAPGASGSGGWTRAARGLGSPRSGWLAGPRAGVAVAPAKARRGLAALAALALVLASAGVGAGVAIAVHNNSTPRTFDCERRYVEQHTVRQRRHFGGSNGGQLRRRHRIRTLRHGDARHERDRGEGRPRARQHQHDARAGSRRRHRHVDLVDR